MNGAAGIGETARGHVNQTAFMFGMLAAAWLIFITMRGDLARWLGVFGFAGSAAPAAPLAGAGVGQSTLPGAGLGTALDPLATAMPNSPTGTV